MGQDLTWEMEPGRNGPELVVASVSPGSVHAASCAPVSGEVTLPFLILLSFYFGFIHSNCQNNFQRGYLCRNYSVNYFLEMF